MVWLTSVTTRPPSRCDNVFGVFDYRHLKREAFFGYRAVTWSGQEILVAEPEKALLDHWHLSPGEWTLERLAEMRYQHLDQLTPAKLEAYAERFRRPRLRRAVERLLLWASCAEQGEVAL
ncbi:MAG: hypothetical protein FJ125_09730 [Deltaproteobacteria bacterium]|nr:hypothetical protein [Deltaproteobacteria bacterium]